MGKNSSFKEPKVNINQGPYRDFERVARLSGFNGKRIKYLLPKIAKSSPLVIDTNFIQLYNLISLIRESFESENNSWLGEYFLNSGYGQMKTLFSLAKESGDVVTTPGIIKEIRRSNGASKHMRDDECPFFCEPLYFETFYSRKNKYRAEIMANRASSLIQMGDELPDILEENLEHYTSSLEESKDKFESKKESLKKTHRKRNGFNKTASLEDIMLSFFGHEIKDSVICSNDADIYFISQELSAYNQPQYICSSCRKVQIGEGFNDTYAVFKAKDSHKK